MSKLTEEASISIDICTFLGSANLFFVGILVAGISNFDQSIRIAILFLIISAIGFIFAALIYAHTSGNERLGGADGNKFIQTGNSISEYLGIYPLIASLPIVINSVLDDVFIKMAVTAVVALTLFLYTSSSLSMAGRQFGRRVAMLFGVYVFLQVIVSSVLQNTSAVTFDIFSGLFLLVMLVASLTGKNRV